MNNSLIGRYKSLLPNRYLRERMDRYGLANLLCVQKHHCSTLSLSLSLSLSRIPSLSIYTSSKQFNLCNGRLQYMFTIQRSKYTPIMPRPPPVTDLLTCRHVPGQFDLRKVPFPYRLEQLVLSHVHLIARRSR